MMRRRPHCTRRFSADSLPRFGTISNVTLAPSGRPSAQSKVATKGKHRFIDKVHVRYIEKEKRHWASLENFNSQRIGVGEKFYRDNNPGAPGCPPHCDEYQDTNRLQSSILLGAAGFFLSLATLVLRKFCDAVPNASTSRRQRVRPEPVRPFRPSQAEQLDEAPEAQAETESAHNKPQSRVVEPIPESVEQARRDEKRNEPPGALVVIMQPLDCGRREQPNANDEQGKSEQIERRPRASIFANCAVREACLANRRLAI